MTVIRIATKPMVILIAFEIAQNLNICHHKCSDQSDSSNPIFAMFTTSWIVLGGLAQSFLVARLLFRGDARLIWLPKPIQILLLICAPILMAPVIVNVYGVIFVTRHADEDGLKEDILRFETV